MWHFTSSQISLWWVSMFACQYGNEKTWWYSSKTDLWLSVHENHRTRWTFPMARPKCLMIDFTNLIRIYKAHWTNCLMNYESFSGTLLTRLENTRKMSPVIFVTLIACFQEAIDHVHHAMSTCCLFPSLVRSLVPWCIFGGITLLYMAEGIYNMGQ